LVAESVASPQRCPCTPAASTAPSTSNPAPFGSWASASTSLPHAIKVLAELDLLEELDAVAIRTRELIMMDRRGNEIWREARGLHAGYDVPQFSVHRGHLQGVLYQAVCERLGETAVVVGRRLVGFERDRDGVLAQFCDQSGNSAEAIQADGLIAADGIHSTVRAAMVIVNEGKRLFENLQGRTDFRLVSVALERGAMFVTYAPRPAG
jgi:2-polyprenyl-6-methoxyphenol hydroxylase-like FAD-dependent oxidoreductase